MKRYQITGLLIVAVLAALRAYSIIDDLIRVLLVDVTYFDLGSIFLLGLVSGLTAGLAIGIWRKRGKGSG
ncbi:MAG TPA: hypothetical protein VMN57_08820 [Anaerolineales bacterium]|nr:hypothetical protein [Anaerolineales bacterium]